MVTIGDIEMAKETKEPSITITPEATLTQYFLEEIQKALKNQQVHTDRIVEIYLATMLAEFSRSETLFARKDEDLKDKPLAVIYAEAMVGLSSAKIRLFKYVGDCSLFIAGFFSDSFQRKIIDVDYVIMLGAISYARLHQMFWKRIEDSHFSGLFHDLSERFPTYVNVFSEISEESRIQSSRDILRLYEKWLKTKSTRMAKQLIAQGIQPNPTVNVRHLH
jgi:hypothetical protein